MFSGFFSANLLETPRVKICEYLDKGEVCLSLRDPVGLLKVLCIHGWNGLGEASIPANAAVVTRQNPLQTCLEYTQVYCGPSLAVYPIFQRQAPRSEVLEFPVQRGIRENTNRSEPERGLIRVVQELHRKHMVILDLAIRTDKAL